MFVKFKIWLPLAVVAVLLSPIHKNAKADSNDLASLINGGTLTDGSVFYSNFQFLADIGTNPLDLAAITVQTFNGPSGLEFLGNGQFNLGPGNDSIILQIAFDIATSGDSFSFSGVDLSNGGAVVSGEGLIDVFNSIEDSSGTPLASTNAILDPLFGISQPTDFQFLGGPQSSLGFDTSLTLFADVGSSVSLDSFRITVSTVPEPSITVLFSCVAAGFTLRRRRTA